jgi:hypothetical protein
VIRFGYWGAINGDSKPSDHLVHCMEYLRRTIMCAADTTLEPFKTEHAGVDGFGTVHQCRDYNQLYNWAEKNQYEYTYT